MRRFQILVSACRAGWVLALLGGLAACGQKGPLYLPTGEAAATRATLTETLAPGTSTTAPIPRLPASAPSTGTANPVHTR